MSAPMPGWNTWNSDPQPAVPTDEEIAEADRLLRMLERKLLSTAEAGSIALPPANDPGGTC